MAGTEIIFIKLKVDTKDKVICDLAEKCFNSGKKTLIFTGSADRTKKLDELLWIWKQASFVPHCIADLQGNPQDETILISTEKLDYLGIDTLIVLQPVDDTNFAGFSLVVDLAPSYDLSLLEAARTRYKSYQEKGYTLVAMETGEFLQAQI